MISGERKKFNLGTARRASLSDGLSNTVIVREGKEASWGYISFSQAFIDFVGSVMPRGVSVVDIAFIQVAYDEIKRKWIVAARYLETAEQAILWVAEQKPQWLKELRNLRKVEHGHSQNTKNSHDRSRARAAEKVALAA